MYNYNYWEIQVGNSYIYLDGDAQIEWNVSWDGDEVEIWRITLNGIDVDFEDEPTIWKKYKHTPNKKLELPDPPSHRTEYDTLQEKWEGQRYG